MHERLTLFSEKFSPSGGTSADGAKKLLGSPALTPLQTVIRETVQNSWDARAHTESGIRYRIHIRSLVEPQLKMLRDHIVAELPESSSAEGLIGYLKSQTPTVMEISDWGTRGLGGPTRADIVPSLGESTDFVNFVRNIGMRTEVEQRGGTYGYGKSSLYSISACATVVIYTVIRVGERAEHRLIGCHLGTSWDDPKSGRMTGRHWWGEIAGDGTYVEPLVGAKAASAAAELGLPTRGEQETGTTLLILDPNLPACHAQAVIGGIQEALLWFFWPKMLSNTAEPPVVFETLYQGKNFPLPNPAEFPPLDLFIEAYHALKQNQAGTEEIVCGRPVRALGRCTVRRGFRGERKFLVPAEESILPHSCSHIALMRPVELVVRYFQGGALPAEGIEWAGVFICDVDPLVEQAFADSEPPAHDDWIPDKLPKGHAKTFVNVALREIRRIAISQAHPPNGRAMAGGAQPSLAEAAARLGRMIPGTGLGDEAATRGKVRNAGRRNSSYWTVTEPRFIRLELGERGAEAIFSVQIKNETGHELKVHAVPGIMIEGVLTAESTGPDGTAVDVISWEDETGVILTALADLTVVPNSNQQYTIRVLVPPMAAIGVRIEATPE